VFFLRKLCDILFLLDRKALFEHYAFLSRLESFFWRW
jgi:hypothetical protein